MRKKAPSNRQTLRFKWIQALFMAAFAIIAIRAVFIHLFPPSQKSLSGIAAKQYQKDLEISSYRGTIFDRRGHPLAISVKKASIFVNPKVFRPTKKQFSKVKKLLGLKKSTLSRLKSKKTYFSWLKRKVSYKTAQKVLQLKIKGLHSITEPSRFYPYGQVASHLIGISGLDNKGLMGLEKQYDKDLRGKVRTVKRARDAKGRPIFLDSAIATPEEPGHDLYLTIDLAIQEIARKALKKGLEDANAKRGFALVQDPHTGHILAMSTLPSYDPNKVASITKENSRNFPLVDPFEPGSVLKPPLVAEALDKNLLELDSLFDCEKSGVYEGKKWRIRDAHPNGVLSVKEVLIKSSNICTYKISDLIGRESMYAMYQKQGLTAKEQNIGYPGQRVGYIPKLQNWTDQRQANIAIGQGIMTTALEISSIYGAFANGGKLLKPILVRHLKGAQGEIKEENTSKIIRQIFSPKSASQVREALLAVVEKGTGSKAKMAAYTAAGKTGTTEKIDPETRAYSDHLRMASFIGYAPALDPHLVIYVMIDEPKNKPYYGGKWAAPVFREIALEALKYLNVAPDKATFKKPRLVKGVLPTERKSM